MTPAPRSLASETRAEGTAPPKTHGAACPHRGRRVPHAGVCALPQRARHAHRVRCCAPPPRRFGNQTVVQEDSLKIAHELPDGAGTNYLKYSTAVRGGHTQYDVRHDTAVSGEHQVHLHRISPASHPHLTCIAPASHLRHGRLGRAPGAHHDRRHAHTRLARHVHRAARQARPRAVQALPSRGAHPRARHTIRLAAPHVRQVWQRVHRRWPQVWHAPAARQAVAAHSSHASAPAPHRVRRTVHD